MAGERPCHVSDAWGREFESLVRYTRTGLRPHSPQGAIDHARFIASWLAGLSGHDGDAILRCVLADAGIAA